MSQVENKPRASTAISSSHSAITAAPTMTTTTGTIMTNTTINSSKMEHLNQLYRSKLKKSLTYLIWSGQFGQVRSVIESSGVNLDETDDWWLSSGSAAGSNIKKTAANAGLTQRRATTSMEAVQMVTAYDAPDSRSALRRRLAYEQYLTDKQQKRCNGKTGRTALMLCSLIEDDAWSYSIAQNLIENGASVNRRDVNGYTALMYACLYERIRLVELFCDSLDGQFNLFEKDIYGNTAFHLASLGRSQRLCLILDKLAARYALRKKAHHMKNFFGHSSADLCKLNAHNYCLKHIHAQQHQKSVHFFNVAQPAAVPLITVNGMQQKGDNSAIQSLNDFRKKSFLVSTILFDKPLHKSSTCSLRDENADTGFMTTSGLINVESLNAQRMPVTKSQNLPRFYKLVQLYKEPLIKQNRLWTGGEEEQSKQHLIVSSQHPGSVYTVTRSVTFVNGDHFNRSNLNAHHVHSSSATASDAKTWRENFELLYETIELQKSKSYRPSTSSLATSVFDNLPYLSGTASVGDTSQMSRKNSLARGRLTSSSSSNHGQTGNEKATNGSIKSQRRSSVKSNK